MQSDTPEEEPHRLTPEEREQLARELSLALPVGQWFTVLAGLDLLCEGAAARILENREAGRTLEELPEAEALAVEAPILARTALLKVLEEHGIVRPE